MSRFSHPLVTAKIKQARKDSGKSQHDMAHHLGIGQQAYSRYETGTAGIPIRTLLKICECLALEPEDLLALYVEEAEVPS